MNENGHASLRERQAAATREAILDAGMDLLREGAPAGFSHESVAKAAGIGARTVYRYFPDRAELLQALWIRLRDATNTRFPTQAEEIVAFAQTAFREFDRNESLIRAVVNSSAGTEVRERGGAEGKPAFAQSLNGYLAAARPAERARVIAVFLAIYSAPFWQLLRDRGGLTGPEAQQAVAWALNALLEALRREHKHHKREEKSERAIHEKAKSGHTRR